MAMAATAELRYPGVQVSGVAEEVAVKPSFGDRIAMGSVGATVRTNLVGAGIEVDGDVQTSSVAAEVHVADLPRRGDSQGRRNEVGQIHARSRKVAVIKDRRRWCGACVKVARSWLSQERCHPHEIT